MALHDICAYGDAAKFGAGKDKAGGSITGHHIIPDHCFYYTGGRGKESCPVIDDYDINDAPVVIVTADANGGKSKEHGAVHSVFDPLELAAQKEDNEWTYAEARDAAVKSVNKALGLSAATVKAKLDAYFLTTLGLSEQSLIRAGEHGTMKHAPNPRRSKRLKTE